MGATLDKLLQCHLISLQANRNNSHNVSILEFARRERCSPALLAKKISSGRLAAQPEGKIDAALQTISLVTSQLNTVQRQFWAVGRFASLVQPKQAVAVFAKATEGRLGSYVFAGQGSDSPLSNMSMAMLLPCMKVEDVTVHGFQSSFREWAGEETLRSREIVEAALAHVIGDKAEQAYRRGMRLKKTP